MRHILTYPSSRVNQPWRNNYCSYADTSHSGANQNEVDNVSSSLIDKVEDSLQFSIERVTNVVDPWSVLKNIRSIYLSV